MPAPVRVRLEELDHAELDHADHQCVARANCTAYTLRVHRAARRAFPANDVACMQATLHS